MKISPAQADRFCNKPDPKIRAIVVYGPDEGLVHERGIALVKSVIGEVDDGFALVQLGKEDIGSDAARLADEAAQVSMLSDKRVIWVRPAGDWLTKALTNALDQPAGDALIVVEAGDLGPRSSLRKLAEGADDAAAVACYADDADTRARVIEQTLRGHKCAIEPDALNWLVTHLGADRGVTRSEVEKLALYMGPDGGTITQTDVEAAVADNANLVLDQVIDAALSGDLVGLDRTLNKSFSEGLNPVTIIRATLNELHRVGLVQAMVDQGRPADQAIKSLRPPVFFKRQNSFRAALRVWPTGRIADARNLLMEAETDCKTTGLPAEAVCHRALLRLGSAARAGR